MSRPSTPSPARGPRSWVRTGARTTGDLLAYGRRTGRWWFPLLLVVLVVAAAVTAATTKVVVPVALYTLL